MNTIRVIGRFFGYSAAVILMLATLLFVTHYTLEFIGRALNRILS